MLTTNNKHKSQATVMIIAKFWLRLHRQNYNGIWKELKFLRVLQHNSGLFTIQWQWLFNKLRRKCVEFQSINQSIILISSSLWLCKHIDTSLPWPELHRRATNRLTWICATPLCCFVFNPTHRLWMHIIQTYSTTPCKHSHFTLDVHTEHMEIWCAKLVHPFSSIVEEH